MKNGRRARGFTLIEMMAVVAIIGLLSSVAVMNIRNMMAVGRVNGAATSTQRLLATARVRALTMHCPVLVQFNGPTYANGSPPVNFPWRQNTVTVFIKGDCSSTNAYFEAGDRILSDFAIERQILVQFPTNIIPSGNLDAESVVIGYPYDQTQAKWLTVDTGTGTFTSQPTPNLDIQFSSGVRDLLRHTYVPDQALPYND